MHLPAIEFAQVAGSPGWQVVALRAPFAAAVATLFAAGAWMLRGVTRGGAVAGAAITFAMWISWPASFLALFTVFVLTAGATRLGYARKQRLGTAEAGEGRRASQVAANLLIAAVAAVVGQFGHQALAFAALSGVLAEATADTVSSEIGQVFASRAYLITTFRSVPPGENGGISAIGTLAGCAGAGLVGAVCAVAYVIGWNWCLPVAAAGIAGMFFDSVLGATLERRGWLNNNAVNFLSTAFAAVLAVLLARF